VNPSSTSNGCAPTGTTRGLGILRRMELLFGLAASLIVVAATPFATEKRWRLVLVMASAGCVLTAFIWWLLPPPNPGTVRASFAAASSDCRWWIGILGALWLYGFVMNVLTEVRRNNEVVRLRNDIQAIGHVIANAVLPRSLNKGQTRQISDVLKDHPPQDISIVTLAQDAEAASFSSELVEAIRRGGWRVTDQASSKDVPSGISTEWIQTQASAQATNEGKMPNLPKMLREAFGAAGLQINGSSGGSGIAITENRFVLRVGNRIHNMQSLRLKYDE
jgi:hypothetical protein